MMCARAVEQVKLSRSNSAALHSPQKVGEFTTEYDCMSSILDYDVLVQWKTILLTPKGKVGLAIVQLLPSRDVVLFLFLLSTFYPAHDTRYRL